MSKRKHIFHSYLISNGKKKSKFILNERYYPAQPRWDKEEGLLREAHVPT